MNGRFPEKNVPVIVLLQGSAARAGCFVFRLASIGRRAGTKRISPLPVRGRKGMTRESKMVFVGENGELILRRGEFPDPEGRSGAWMDRVGTVRESAAGAGQDFLR